MCNWVRQNPTVMITLEVSIFSSWVTCCNFLSSPTTPYMSDIHNGRKGMNSGGHSMQSSSSVSRCVRPKTLYMQISLVASVSMRQHSKISNSFRVESALTYHSLLLSQSSYDETCSVKRSMTASYI